MCYNRINTRNKVLYFFWRYPMNILSTPIPGKISKPNFYFQNTENKKWLNYFHKLKEKLKPDINVEYPESDGEPMAENTKQYKMIVKIKENLEYLFRDRNDIFIAADLFWYPVQYNNKKKYAPDVMVAFGRPKGDRGAYLQWEEGNIAPQVVFEILSPGNSNDEMRKKFKFYQKYGVEEYYVYDPNNNILEGWERAGNRLKKIKDMDGRISPRLKIQFVLSFDGLILYYPDGKEFNSYSDEAHRADDLEIIAKNERQRAEKETQRAEKEKQRAEKEKQRADELEKKLAELMAQTADHK